MSTVAFVKEAFIAAVTAAVVIPLRWFLSTPLDPARDTHSPGLDLVALTLAGAGAVMLLRSTWRESTGTGANSDRTLDDREWRELGDSLGSGSC